MPDTIHIPDPSGVDAVEIHKQLYRLAEALVMDVDEDITIADMFSSRLMFPRRICK